MRRATIFLSVAAAALLLTLECFSSTALAQRWYGGGWGRGIGGYYGRSYGYVAPRYGTYYRYGYPGYSYGYPGYRYGYSTYGPRYYSYGYVPGYRTYGYTPYYNRFYDGTPYYSGYTPGYTDVDPYDGAVVRQPNRTYTSRSYSLNVDTQARQVTSQLVDTTQQSTEAGLNFLRQAEEAFRSGDYDRAAQQASHASVEMPKQGKVFLFTAQALFALGDYQGAAAAIHQAASLLPTDDLGYVVEHFRDYYHNRDYVDQMTQLKQYVKDNPDAAYAYFVRGYHFGFLGHHEAAIDDLTRAYELQPRNALAAQLITHFGGHPPEVNAHPEQAAITPEGDAIGGVVE